MSDGKKRFLLHGREQVLRVQITQFMALFQLLEDKDLGYIYGMPTLTFKEMYDAAPQIILEFRQNQIEVDSERGFLDAKHSFRLVGYTPENITREYIENLANRIRLKFGGNTPFSYTKGKSRITYFDKAKGYDIRVNTITPEEGFRVIEQILDVKGDSPKTEKINIVTSRNPTQRFDDTPGTTVILGRRYKRKTKRRVGRVIFRRAFLHLDNVPFPIQLYPTLSIPSPVSSDND